jgi:ribulose-5-phosphate 4-epimerase/fuculose-1-phosphate aldolase
MIATNSQQALCIEQLRAARARLSVKGLLKPDDTLSIRVPGGDAVFLTEIAGGEAPHRSLGLASITTGAAEIHRLAYAARADVGAILLNRQPWAAALPAAGGTLPGVFDEQLRQLGWQVTQLTPSPLFRADPELARGGNAFGMGEAVLCLGMTAERLVFNAELLEKCAKAYVLASATGLPVTQIPWLVRWIATRRLRREQRRAAASFARGELPAKSTGYK